MSSLPSSSAQATQASFRKPAYGLPECNDAIAAREAIADRWADLHASAIELAQFAGRAEPLGEPALFDGIALPNGLANASRWQCELARQGTDDLAAMLRPGLDALRTLSSRGGDPAAAAQALMREFERARDGIERILPTNDRTPAQIMGD